MNEAQEGNVATQSSLNELIMISFINFHNRIKDESIHGNKQIPQKELIPQLESIPPGTNSFCKRNLFLPKVPK